MVCVVLWAGDIRHLHSSGEASGPISDALLASTVFTPPEFTMCNNTWMVASARVATIL